MDRWISPTTAALTLELVAALSLFFVLGTVPAPTNCGSGLYPEPAPHLALVAILLGIVCAMAGTALSFKEAGLRRVVLIVSGVLVGLAYLCFFTLRALAAMGC